MEALTWMRSKAPIQRARQPLIADSYCIVLAWPARPSAFNGSAGLVEAIAREKGVKEPPVEQRPTGDVPTRPLGKTGLQVSAICFGGSHLGKIEDETQAIRLLQEAIDSGVTFLDNAW